MREDGRKPLIVLPDGVPAEWRDFLSLGMNTDGGGKPLDLAMFTATIGVSASDANRWDSALGVVGLLDL
jgi:hypothetical protein